MDTPRLAGVLRAALSSGIIVVGAPGPASAEPVAAVAEARLADGIVAVVDGEPLLWSELRARLRPLLSGANPEERSKVYRESVGPQLEELIDAKLVAQEARRRSLEVSKDEIARSLDAVAAQNGWSVAQLIGEIEKIGWTRGVYEAEIGAQLLRFKVLSAYRVSDHPELILAHPEDMQKLERALLRDLRGRAVIETRLAP